MSFSRRALLGAGVAGAGAGLLAGLTGWRVALAGGVAPAVANPNARLVLVLLRGGMDSLGALPRPMDADWLALGRTLPTGHLALADGFALHPSLSAIHPWWSEGSLAVVPAAGQPGAKRSHFDAQDLLEEGGASLGATPTGWLHRALVSLDAPDAGAAIGSGLPLVLRGEDGGGAASVDPSREPEVDAATLEAVAALWASDPVLSRSLAEASRARSVAGPAADRSERRSAADMGRNAPRTDGMSRAGMESDRTESGAMESGAMESDKNAKKGQAVVAQAEGAGRLLASSDGYRVAVVESGGWDTHANEPAVLARLLSDLANGLVALREGLGSTWENTIVVTATEFGRTAKPNGTSGTDHGSGSAMFLAGGALRGGRIVGDWPGLSKLFEARDLSIATDSRAVFKGVLAEHMGVSREQLDRVVFPDSGGCKPLSGLIR